MKTKSVKPPRRTIALLEQLLAEAYDHNEAQSKSLKSLQAYNDILEATQMSVIEGKNHWQREWKDASDENTRLHNEVISDLEDEVEFLRADLQEAQEALVNKPAPAKPSLVILLICSWFVLGTYLNTLAVVPSQVADQMSSQVSDQMSDQALDTPYHSHARTLPLATFSVEQDDACWSVEP